MIQIHFIYADKCKHCAEALSSTERAIGKCKEIPCQILKFKYDTTVALSIARNKGIDDLPGFVVANDEVFVGDDYDEERIIKAIKKASKS